MKNPRPRPSRYPNRIDEHLAEQISERRRAIAMSQNELGRELRISLQQIHKYEKGKNRLSAARLYEICQVLDVPIASMFDGIPRSARASKQKRPATPGAKKKPPA
jgi:transcriptional regulator with XRE-family HTH domain